MNVMPISELIARVTKICKENGVKKLYLFGSFATGTATPESDIDIFDYDNIRNEFLLEDIEKYGKQIY